jgi:hypothetical protein
MKHKKEFVSELVAGNMSQLLSWGVFVLVFLGIWGFIAITRIGITPDVAYWNEAGVPILGLQVLFSLVVSLSIGYWLSRIQGGVQKTDRIDRILSMVIPLAIWALAAGIWLAEPQEQSFNAPRPSPPTYEYYPFSDATSYDLGSQYALIGQGINNNMLTDKPFYMLFLTLLHAVGGQSVRVVSSLQVLVLALFPVMLYLLGKEVRGRGAGLLVALLAIFKERNAIAAVLNIQVSHVKLMMTEVPTALLISVATLLMVRWAKRDAASSGSLPFWVGGVIGAAVLLRANAFTLLPLAILIPFLLRRRTWRQAFLSSGFVLIAFLIILLPWLVTNRDQTGRTYLQVKLDNVLERYQQSLPSGSGWSPNSKDEATPAEFAMLTISQGGIKTDRFSLDEDISPLEFVPSHFFHNQIAALFTLPMTLNFQDLTKTIESKLWEKNWAGDLTVQNIFMLLLNLCLIGLGLSQARKRWRLAGFIPVLVEILYYMANALARTSGSRYLVPVDWVVYFYYSLGLIQLGEWLLMLITRRKQLIAKDSPTFGIGIPRYYWITPVFSLILLGMLMPLSGILIPQRFPDLNKGDAYRILQSEVPLVDLGFTQKQIREFLDNQDSVVFQGRLLYPRYFLANEGLCTKCFILDAASRDQSFSRLTFIVLGPFSAGVVVEMNELPEYFRRLDLSKAPDVWVIGCKNHEKVVGRFKSFHSSVQGLVITISGRKGMQVYSPAGIELRCSGE